MLTHSDIVKLMKDHRIHYSTEALMHIDVANVFLSAGVEFVAEHRFSGRDRVDFWIPSAGIAIECKIDGGATAVLSQCLRYAEHDEVASVILLTCRARHKAEMSHFDTIGGKAFSLVWVGAL